MIVNRRHSKLNPVSAYSVACGFILMISTVNSTVSAQGQYSKLCNEGFSYEKSGNLDAAIAKYASAIMLKPGSWEAYSYRAKANYRKQKTDEAIADITQAITLAPSNIALYEVRSEIYSAKGMRDKAVEDLNVVIAGTDSKDTKLFRLYSGRGQHLYWLEKYEPAISDFTSAIQIAAPGSRDASLMYSYRATSYFRLGKFQESIADFDQYISISQGGDISSVFYQGQALLKTGNRERAAANAKRMVEMDPSKEVYFSGDRALDIYDLDMRRKNAKQYMDEAQALLAEEKSLSSRSLANIKLNDAFERLNKAWLYSSGLEKQDRDMKDQIIKDLFSVHSRMKPKPEIPEAARRFMVQANSATNEKKYAEAINLWTKVQSIAPWYPTSYFNSALLYENLGNFRYSIDNMNKYLELYPDAADARAAKDKIYEWEGKVKNQPQSSAAGPVSDIMLNQAAPYVPGKPKVFIKGGLTMPTGNTALAPGVPSSGSTADAVWQSIFYEQGTIGMQQGWFVEAGLDLMSISRPRLVRFYYHPLVLAFSMNPLDWSSLGGIFENQAIYTKPVSLIEVAQRYGIGFVPTPKLTAAIYYRPGVAFPLNFEILHEGANPTRLSVQGSMSTEKIFNFSNTFGVSLGYSFVSLSYEMYSIKPGYDIRIIYQGLPAPYEYSLSGRMPVKMNKAALTFTF